MTTPPQVQCFWRKAGCQTFAPGVFFFVVLSACAPEDYPGDPLTDTDSSLPMPSIVPLDPLITQIGDPRDAADPDPELRQQGEALRVRASEIPEPEPALVLQVRDLELPSTEGAGDVSERGADLRKRADAVRNAPPE